jgi:hypothetical protein
LTAIPRQYATATRSNQSPSSFPIVVCSVGSAGGNPDSATGLLINSIDSSKLLPGDLAATADGVHILAYIGDKKWIEADPTERKVIVVATPERINYWFGVPVYILRWQQLAN